MVLGGEPCFWKRFRQHASRIEQSYLPRRRLHGYGRMYPIDLPGTCLAKANITKSSHKATGAFTAVVVVANKAFYRQTDRQTGGVGPLRNPSCTEGPVGSGTARGAATRPVSTVQSGLWLAIPWVRVIGVMDRSQSAFCAMLAMCSCDVADDGHTGRRTCSRTVRWDKAILRYSSRVSKTVIELLLGIAEIIPPAWHHLSSHFGLECESVA